MQEKKAIRKKMIETRLAMPSEVRAAKSERISDELIARFHPAVCCSFVSYRGEVDLKKYHEYLIKCGVHLLLPRVEGEEMTFYQVTSLNALVKSDMGILEPNPNIDEKWSYENIWKNNPLIVTPAVSFTREGARLGYGGGFYDRFFALSNGRGEKIGVCFEEQLSETLPIEPHDYLVDGVIYE